MICDRIAGVVLGSIAGVFVSYFFQVPLAAREQTTLAKYFQYIWHYTFGMISKTVLGGKDIGGGEASVNATLGILSVALIWGFIGAAVGYFGFRLVRKVLFKIGQWAE